MIRCCRGTLLWLCCSILCLIQLVVAIPTVAYGIMVYQRPHRTVLDTFRQFSRLFDALYDPANTYIVHVDIKSDEELISMIQTSLSRIGNAYMLAPESVSWGGITVVERTLALMQVALEVDSKWSWFVNLGHEDYPIKSQGDFRKKLGETSPGTNFIHCWPLEEHDFFGQVERHGQRVRGVYVDDFSGKVHRANTRLEPPGEFSFYKALQQMVLSRDFVTHAVQSINARRLLLFMATAEAPDELFFPTLLQNSRLFANTATCEYTLHYSLWIRPGGSWHPEYLTLLDLGTIMSTWDKNEYFFLRKVDEHEGSGPLLNALDHLRTGGAAVHILPIIHDWLGTNNENVRDNFQMPQDIESAVAHLLSARADTTVKLQIAQIEARKAAPRGPREFVVIPTKTNETLNRNKNNRGGTGAPSPHHTQRRAAQR